MRRGFDPDRYKIVLFDQRGCGRSTPHASDPAADMSRNTTSHLLADMERLRQYLAIDRWLLSGGSWGCTLALAYAERYPERVSQIVLLAITTSRRSETEWLYRGVSRFFPEAYEKFRAGAPEAGRDGDLLAAYARRMESPDFQVRVEAAQAWCDWEDAVLSRERRQSLSPYSASQQARTEQWAFVRICANYATHGAAAPLLSL